MPFEFTILDWREHNPILSLGQFPDALTTSCNNNIGETRDCIEFVFGGILTKYSVTKTLIHSDTEQNAKNFCQSLQEVPPNYSRKLLYLKGVLVDEPAKKILFYTSQDDKNPIHIFIPIIPRTNLDYIKVDNICYRCEKIIFTKEDIKVVASPNAMELERVELNFYDKSLFD